MSEHNAMQAYLETVAAQIRWKRARTIILPELAQHLEDQRDAFRSEGLDNAEQRAVEEMGDPVSVGMELDRLYRPRPQWDMIFLTILFALVGTMLRVWLTKEFEHPFPLYRTLCSLVLGCSALLLGYFSDFTRLGRHGRKLYFLTLVLSALLLSVSPIRNGVSRYTCYVTLVYPVVYAFWLYTWRQKGWRGAVCSVLGGIPLGLFCLLTPYLFGLFLLCITGLVLTASAAWNDWFGIGKRNASLCVTSCALLTGGAALWCGMSSGYYVQRLITAFHPEQDPFGCGYRALTIREVLGTSQWIGAGSWDRDGVLPALEKTLPEYDSDAFLTTLVYKLGWLPFLLVLSAFMVLVAWLLFRCFKQKSYLGKWVVSSVLIMLSLQACCSIIWNFGYTLFNTAFPLIIGNLNTVINMGLIGLALSVFRSESVFRDFVYEPQPLLSRYRVRVMVQKISR